MILYLVDIAEFMIVTLMCVWRKQYGPLKNYFFSNMKLKYHAFQMNVFEINGISGNV